MLLVNISSSQPVILANTLDFTITADFIASDLDMGRVGVRLGNQTIVIDEELNVSVDNFGDPESNDGVISVYD